MFPRRKTSEFRSWCPLPCDHRCSGARRPGGEITPPFDAGGSTGRDSDRPKRLAKAPVPQPVSRPKKFCDPAQLSRAPRNELFEDWVWNGGLIRVREPVQGGATPVRSLVRPAGVLASRRGQDVPG